MVPDRTSWRSLLPGLIAIAAIIAATAAVLVFARVGALHGDTARIYVTTEQANGLMKGADVWLAGEKVGLVADIRFRPVSVPREERLLLELELLEANIGQLRDDSYAQIRTGGSLIGAQVVYLTIGTSGAGLVEAGDTLRSEPQADTEGLASQVANASKQFPAIINNVKLLTSQLESARGTIGAFGAEDGVQQLFDVGTRAASLTTRATEGQGTIGLVMRRTDHLDRAKSAMARTDSIRALLASDQSSLGRLRRDSTLLREISKVRNEASIVGAMLAEPRGTAGRAMADSAIVRELGRVEQELSKLLRDIARDPLRFIGR